MIFKPERKRRSVVAGRAILLLSEDVRPLDRSVQFGRLARQLGQRIRGNSTIGIDNDHNLRRILFQFFKREPKRVRFASLGLTGPLENFSAVASGDIRSTIFAIVGNNDNAIVFFRLAFNVGDNSLHDCFFIVRRNQDSKARKLIPVNFVFSAR